MLPCRASGTSGLSVPHMQCILGQISWGVAAQHLQGLPEQAADALKFLQPIPPHSIPGLRGHTDGLHDIPRWTPVAMLCYSSPLFGGHSVSTHCHGPAKPPAGLLQAIQRQQPQPQLDLGCQGIMMEFLHRARPLHWLHLSRDSVLWAALTMGHYGLFCSRELAQPKLAEAGVPWYIHVQDVTLHFFRGHLHYICILLSSSKMDPFHQGSPIIFGCTGTPMCGACEAWYILQQHQWTQTPLDAPFLQINIRLLDHMILVRHMKDTATWLGLDSSRYSDHSLCIWRSTSAAQARLSQWQIKLMGWWNSQAYQVYIKQDALACAGLAACMAANLWSSVVCWGNHIPVGTVQLVA